MKKLQEIKNEKQESSIKHFMNLSDDSFDTIENGTKNIEMRLNDEKRSIIKVGDTIEFSNTKTKNKIVVDVISVNKYKNFDELYKHYSKESLGYKSLDTADPNDMKVYYSKEQINKYGVLAIGVRVVTFNDLSIISTEDFYRTILNKITQMDVDYIDITSGDIHRELGGYPGKNHRMPTCCIVMKKLMSSNDMIIYEPKKGKGASLTMRYYKR